MHMKEKACGQMFAENILLLEEIIPFVHEHLRLQNLILVFYEAFWIFKFISRCSSCME